MGADKSKLNILVADDEEKQRKIMRILLLNEGY